MTRHPSFGSAQDVIIANISGSGLYSIGWYYLKCYQLRPMILYGRCYTDEVLADAYGVSLAARFSAIRSGYHD